MGIVLFQDNCWLFLLLEQFNVGTITACSAVDRIQSVLHVCEGCWTVEIMTDEDVIWANRAV